METHIKQRKPTVWDIKHAWATYDRMTLSARNGTYIWSEYVNRHLFGVSITVHDHPYLIIDGGPRIARSEWIYQLALEYANP